MNISNDTQERYGQKLQELYRRFVSEAVINETLESVRNMYDVHNDIWNSLAGNKNATIWKLQVNHQSWVMNVGMFDAVVALS